MNRYVKVLAAALLSLSPLSAGAQELTADEVKRLALEAIRENPQIIMEAVAILQAREEEAARSATAQVLSEQRLMLEQDPNAPVIGNPEGDVTLVEFFDYNCPYCKRAAPDVKTLLEFDDNVRIVYREWPILGEGSVFAARAALAARNQGKYEEFHWAMMELNGRAEEASVLRVAAGLGIDIDRLKADMQSEDVEEHIQTSMNLASLLGFNGTPSWVIGDNLVPGLVAIDELQRLIEETRTQAGE